MLTLWVGKCDTMALKEQDIYYDMIKHNVVPCKVHEKYIAIQIQHKYLILPMWTHKVTKKSASNFRGHYG